MIRLLHSLFRHRHLVLTLTRRELAARYRGSVLGFFWSLVNPLLLLLVYSFVFSVIFQARDPTVDQSGPYALFLATGVIPWMWISTSWIEGSNSLLANSGLIRKAAFPAETLPVVTVFANLVHFLLAVPVLLLAFVITAVVAKSTGAGSAAANASLSWSNLLLPAVILLQIPMVAGLAMASAALNVHFKDFRDILQNLLTILFFMTPILYTLKVLERVPVVYWAVACNPFTPFMLAYQETMFYGRVPEPWLWAVMVVVSAVTWALTATLFHRLDDTLVEAV